jgi:solute:Na+ symporter, SSS family
MNITSVHPVDLLVLTIYLLSVLFLAFKSGKLSGKFDSGDSVMDQYMAGGSLTFIESLCSIIATEVSALTFLGIPAIAFAADYSFIQIYFGAIFGRIIIAKIFLPKIYKKGLTLYGIMGDQDGSVNGQRITSSMFFITKLLAVGVRLFSGSILVAAFFGINIYTAVFIISLITFFYTLIGGLKAVVRTDILQMGLFISGGLVAHYLIPDVAGRSWIEMMGQAFDAGKMQFIDFSNPWPFIIGIIGGTLFDSATHGVDQDFVQRLMANKSLKHAQWAIMSSVFLSIFVGFLFLSVGSLLWSYYQEVSVPIGVKPDQLFAHFITNYFPKGLKGLMVAGILAATMSTLDSTINALSSCFYNDIMPNRHAHKVGYYVKADSLLITTLLMLVAFIASASNGLLMLGLKIVSWTAGPLWALFVCTVIIKGFFKIKLTAPITIGAYAFGISAVALNSFVLKWSWHFNTYLGVAAALLWIFIYKKLNLASARK